MMGKLVMMFTCNFLCKALFFMSRGQACSWKLENVERQITFRNPLAVQCLRVMPLLLCLLFLEGNSSIPAQGTETQLKVTVDATEVTIGDIVTLSVTVQHPSSTKLAFPSVEESLGEWIVRSVSRSPLRKLKDGIEEDSLKVQLTVYKTGEFEIPALEVELVKSTGEKSILVSQPIKIKVESVLAENEQDLKDLKPQAEIAADYKPFLLLLAALASIVFLVYRLINIIKRRKNTLAAEVKDSRPPEQIAREAIQLLLSRKLVEHGFLKEFYLELSEIVKRYIGTKLNIPSLERTTEEFTSDLKQAPLSAMRFQTIREFLMDCDLVKFAKYHPSRQETQKILAQAFEIIDSIAASQRDVSVQHEVPV